MCAADRAELLADAICVHTTPGVSLDRDGALGCYLQWGAMVDGAGLRAWDVAPANVAEVLRRYPRVDFKRELIELMRAEAAAVPGGSVRATDPLRPTAGRSHGAAGRLEPDGRFPGRSDSHAVQRSAVSRASQFVAGDEVSGRFAGAPTRLPPARLARYMASSAAPRIASGPRDEPASNATPTLAVVRMPSPSAVLASRTTVSRCSPTSRGRSGVGLRAGRRRTRLPRVCPAHRCRAAVPAGRQLTPCSSVIAGRVAVVVVDRLEAVEVDHQQRAGGVVARRDRQLVAQALFEPAPVGQAGQLVLAGEAFQLSLQAPAVAVGAAERRGGPDDHRQEACDRRHRQKPGADAHARRRRLPHPRAAAIQA